MDLFSTADRQRYILQIPNKEWDCPTKDNDILNTYILLVNNSTIRISLHNYPSPFYNEL